MLFAGAASAGARPHTASSRLRESDLDWTAGFGDEYGAIEGLVSGDEVGGKADARAFFLVAAVATWLLDVGLLWRPLDHVGRAFTGGGDGRSEIVRLSCLQVASMAGSALRLVSD